MPTPTIIVEDGTGVANANSYIDVDYANTYLDGVLYVTNWNGADPAEKTRAVIMAARMIDASFKFNGGKTSDSNTMEWPRIYAPNKEGLGTAYWLGYGTTYGNFWGSNVIPERLKKAQAELANELLTKNRNAEWGALGVKSVGLGQGAVDVTFTDDAAESAAMPFTPSVLDLLSPLGYPRSGSAMADVRRG